MAVQRIGIVTHGIDVVGIERGYRGLLDGAFTVLGHVVRGGRPSAFDRLLGGRAGARRRDPVAGRSVLLAGRPRRSACGDREPAVGPEPAGALARRRIRRDRGCAAAPGVAHRAVRQLTVIVE
jgi:hypothetical protein